jgi:chromosomal replication initiator protein
MTNHEIWQAVLAEFELTVSKATFTTWFSNTGISSYENGSVVICVPNTFTQNWLEKKYHANVVKSLEQITGKPVKKVEYKVGNIKEIGEKECTFASPKPIIQPAVSQFNAQVKPKKPSYQNIYGLNPNYVFSSFVVGKANELAHAAAQAVAKRPGEAYNPLFIYGGVGLGKTHLLQAIAHEMLKNNDQTRVLYVSSEKFTNEFVSAVKEGRAKEFKDRYRNVDLLLIDDIQFIAGKEQTQEEFFHTFNELHQRSKQVVMTSDRPPKAIPNLEDRLRSRFEWGMIVDIGSPDLETRSAILQTKAQEKNFFLSNEIINLIAVTIQSNIRELEGALNKIIAYHELKKIDATVETVKPILNSLTQQSSKKSATPKKIISIVGKYFDIMPDDLFGKSREKKLSFPRQIVMFILREDLKMSFPAIGNELGGRDHTTAMHAHTKILTEAENDLKLKQDLIAIRQQIYSESL